jgi:NitT/TauT family transport system ATP-binding protein
MSELAHRGSGYISLRNVGKVFATSSGNVEAIRDVSIDVSRNEFVTIVGQSGCGKSTLLRLVAGLTPPSSGEIHLDGKPVTGPRRNIGVVFQSALLLQWKNVLDNILLPAKILKLDPARSRERAQQLLRMVGLEKFADKFPNELSGGMQQRVAICRALLFQPSILLMDEPFGALDALTREELSVELLRLWGEEVKTVLFITHSISEAVLLADRVVVFKPHPGSVAEIVDVRLPRPRDLAVTLTPEFQGYVGYIRNKIFKNSTEQ